MNREATAIARQRRNALNRAFQKWLFNESRERREWAVRAYNDRFNAYVQPKVDGSYLMFPGMTSKWRHDIAAHQRNAIARALQFGNTLFAHVVGAGKSLVMAGTGMELRRLGLARKPLYVVPNHLLAQAPGEFQQSYPNAKLLIAKPEDLEKENRLRFTARIASGDWDGIFIPYSSFVRISMSAKAETEYHQGLLDEIETAIIEQWQVEAEQDSDAGRKSQRGGRTPPTIKRLENTRDAIKKKLDDIAARPKDDLLDFEQLGVDALFVDEAHSFKNLYFHTRQQAAGIPSDSDAQRATDLFLKVRYINKMSNYRNVFLATGTPVSNSMAEVFVMQKFLQENALEQAGIDRFDAWLAQFGTIAVTPELDPSGTGVSARARLSDFRNLPDLAMMFRQVTDVQMIDDLPELKTRRPPLETGGIETIVVPMTAEQEQYLDELKHRTDHLDPKRRDLDNMAKITVDGRLSALDMRMIDRRREDNPGNKMNRVADEVSAIYKQWDKDKGTQLVFMDLGTPGVEKRAAAPKKTRDPMTGAKGTRPATEAEKHRGVELYADLKAKLIARGVKRHEIAFIQDIKDVRRRSRTPHARRSTGACSAARSACSSDRARAWAPA